MDESTIEPFAADILHQKIPHRGSFVDADIRLVAEFKYLTFELFCGERSCFVLFVIQFYGESLFGGELQGVVDFDETAHRMIIQDFFYLTLFLTKPAI